MTLDAPFSAIAARGLRRFFTRACDFSPWSAAACERRRGAAGATAG